MLQNIIDDKATLAQVMLGVVRQQVITWAHIDPDLCPHMASLGHNELNYWGLMTSYGGEDPGHHIPEPILFIVS